MINHLVYFVDLKSPYSEIKIGYSRTDVLLKRVVSAQTYSTLEVECLGVILVDSKEHAVDLETELLDTFGRTNVHRPGSELIFDSTHVRCFIAEKCIDPHPFLEQGRQKRNEEWSNTYNSNENYRESKKAAARERYANPDYREKQLADQNERYRNDPEFRERKKAYQRERYRKQKEERCQK